MGAWRDAWSVHLEGLALVACVLSLVWVVSVVKKDASIIDPCWGPGFALVGWYWHARFGADSLRAAVQLGAVTLWGVRLGAYLTWRAWGEDEDRRYQAMRAKAPRAFPWISLFSVFWLQAFILAVVAAPLFAAQGATAQPGWTLLDGVGVGLFAVGLAFESVGDWQLARFKADPENAGQVLDRGLWRYTRHPNYFGDALVWWGLGLMAVSVPGGWLALVGPAVMTFFLMKVSGVALLERSLAKTKPAYRDYVRRTPAFFPWFPKRSDEAQA